MVGNEAISSSGIVVAFGMGGTREGATKTYRSDPTPCYLDGFPQLITGLKCRATGEARNLRQDILTWVGPERDHQDLSF